MDNVNTVALRDWPWLAPLGALVSAAKDRDLSSGDQSYEVNVAHNTLFDILREREGRLASLEAGMRGLPVISVDGGHTYLRPGEPGYSEGLAGMVNIPSPTPADVESARNE